MATATPAALSARPAAEAEGGGFIRLVGPGANGVGGTFNVNGGAGQPANGTPANGFHLSPGGSSRGAGGAVLNTGVSFPGGTGELVRTEVPDPIALVSLNKALPQ